MVRSRVWLSSAVLQKRDVLPLICTLDESGWISMGTTNSTSFPSLPLQPRELNCDVVSHKLFQNDVHTPFYGTVWLISASTWSATNNWLFLAHVLWLCFTAVQNNWSLRKPGGPGWKMWLSLTPQHLGREWMRPHSVEQTNHGENQISRQRRALVATWVLALVSTCCQRGEDIATMAGGMLWYINPRVMQSQFFSCFSWCNALFSPKPSWFRLAEGLNSSDYYFWTDVRAVFPN